MKKVITRVNSKWEGFTICEDSVVTREALDEQKEEIRRMIIDELGLENENMTDFDIQISYEVMNAETEEIK